MKNKKNDHVLWFSEDSVLGDGLMTVPSHLKIAGRVNMNVECSGKLVIAESGIINGNIKASEIYVFGKIQGDIVAHEVVTIHKTGVVSGHIASNKLVIEEGAVCNLGMAVGEDVAFRQRKTVKDAPAAFVNGTERKRASGNDVKDAPATFVKGKSRQAGKPEKQDKPDAHSTEKTTVQPVTEAQTIRPTEINNAQPVPVTENKDEFLNMNISAVSDPEKRIVSLVKQSDPPEKKQNDQLVPDEQKGSYSEPDFAPADEHIPYW